MEQNEPVLPHLMLKETENITDRHKSGFGGGGILLVTVTAPDFVLCIRHQENPKPPRFTREQPLPQPHGISLKHGLFHRLSYPAAHWCRWVSAFQIFSSEDTVVPFSTINLEKTVLC